MKIENDLMIKIKTVSISLFIFQGPIGDHTTRKRHMKILIFKKITILMMLLKTVKIHKEQYYEHNDYIDNDKKSNDSTNGEIMSSEEEDHNYDTQDEDT